MKTDNLTTEIELPKGIEAKVNGRFVTITGPKGENVKEFKLPTVMIKVEGSLIKLETVNGKKSNKKFMNTLQSHLKNMIIGAEEGYIYTLKICSGHFPMNVTLSGKDLIVKNFLGEKVPRVLKIKEGATVKIDGNDVTIESTNKETAGQVAADIEKLTKVTNRDIRIFQDGIYLTKKSGKDIV